MKFREVAPGPVAVHAALTLVPILLFLLSLGVVVRHQERIASIEQNLPPKQPQDEGGAETGELNKTLQKLQIELSALLPEIEELRAQVNSNDGIQEKITELQEQVASIQEVIDGLKGIRHKFLVQSPPPARSPRSEGTTASSSRTLATAPSLASSPRSSPRSLPSFLSPLRIRGRLRPRTSKREEGASEDSPETLATLATAPSLPEIQEGASEDSPETLATAPPAQRTLSFESQRLASPSPQERP